MVQQKSRQESLADEEKRESNKKNKLLKKIIRKKLDDMSYVPRKETDDLKIKKEFLLEDKKTKKNEDTSNLTEGPAKVTFDPSNPESMKNFRKMVKLLETDNAKGGMINKYAKGGAVKKNKSNMITTKGWGASRKT